MEKVETTTKKGPHASEVSNAIDPANCHKPTSSASYCITVFTHGFSPLSL